MQSDNLLEQTIDELIQETYNATEPGAAVIVVKDGEVIFRKGHGMANLELGVPIEPDMVFRIGSITKQFTAVAILMLVEQGKLSLDDSISKFLTDYPTRGHVITIEHLLTHTSGIKSYTNMPEWLSLWRKDFTVEELITFFKDQPMDFAPDTRWAYSNSGYTLLGAVIEKVSGQTYEQFIQQNIFTPLGMKQSYLDSTSRLIPRRADGYDKDSEGYVNAPYISMTQFFSAGALTSTVDDLAIWDAALYTEQLLKQETLQKAFIPHQLANGDPTSYGYGWGISEYEGHLQITHGGFIHGFLTYAIRMPNDRVFVAVFSNNGGVSSALLAFKVAASVIGKPYKDPIVIELGPEAIARYEGVYKTNDSEESRITREENRLYSQVMQDPRVELVAYTPNEFFIKGNSPVRFRFISDASEAVIAVEMLGYSGFIDVARKVDENAI